MKDRTDGVQGRRFGRGRGHGGRHEGGRRPKLGRFFAHGDLRFLILKLIADKPRHGYELIKAIEEQVAGAYSPSPGVIYPTLTLLEELDWIRAIASDGSKRLFEITAEGSLALGANRATVEAIFARMAEASDNARDDMAVTEDAVLTPRLRVALDDLSREVERRLADGPLTDDRIATIVEALARASTEIERA